MRIAFDILSYALEAAVVTGGAVVLIWAACVLV
jgi:hypothetical protein